MQMKDAVLILLIGYLIAITLIGIRGRKFNHTFQSRIIAGKASTLPILIGAAMGSHIGSGFVVGGAEYGVDYGIGGAWYALGCGISNIVAGLFFVRFIYRAGYLSLSDYFLERYKHHSIRLICMISLLFGYFAVFAGQLLAGKAIFYVAGIDGNWGLIITAAVALIYSVISGFWGALAVASIQTALIFVSMIAAIFFLFANYGTASLVSELPAGYFGLFPFDSETMVMITLPTVLASVTSQPVFQRTASAKSERSAVLSHVISGLFMIPISFIPAVFGMYGKLFFPSTQTSEVFSRVAVEKLPFLLGALLLTVVICAVISTCSSVLITTSTNMIHDMIQRLLGVKIGDRGCKTANVVISTAVCIVGICLAVKMDDIVEVLSLGYTFSMMGSLVPFLGGIFWKKGTATGAAASAICGIGVVLLNFAGWISLPYASVSPLIPAAVVYVAVSLLTQPHNSHAKAS